MFVVHVLVIQMRTLVSMHVINNVKIMSETDLHSSFRGIISPITNGKMAVFSTNSSLYFSLFLLS